MFKSKVNGIKKCWLTLSSFAVIFFLSLDLAAQEEINYQGLLPGVGVELVLGNCTVCHSTDIIIQNHMSREAWDKTLNWMQKEQGMWELDKEDRKIILDYLSTAQGISGKRISRKAIKKKNNSMYEFDYRPNPL